MRFDAVHFLESLSRPAPADYDEACGFVSRITSHPHDLTARLVYADWLQERGHDAIAELIRITVELIGIEEGTARFSFASHISENALRVREAVLMASRDTCPYPHSAALRK